MTTPSDQPVVDAAGNGARSKDEIEAEIQRTRQQLGETVDALSQKLDVKSRLKDEAQHRREQVTREVQQRPVVPVALAAGVVLLTTLLVRRRRRKH